VRLPADLRNEPNGQLPAGLLTDVAAGARLHHLAGRAWAALVDAAASAGVALTFTHGGCYRTYQQQETLFLERYTTDVLDRPSKMWNGRRWYQRPGVAMAAVPGTSNHGLGLAVDTAIGTSPDSARPLDDVALGWLLSNAARFGWSWEAQSEPWHIRYVSGDLVPPAVVDHEQEEPSMICIDYRPGEPEWVALVSTGTEICHIWNGHADGVYRQVRAPRVTVDKHTLSSLLLTWRAVGPNPFAGTAAHSDPDLAALWTVDR
jgi:hypothetical protein